MPNCELRPPTASVRPGENQQEVQGTTRLDAAFSRNFKKVKQEPRQAIHMEKPQETTGMGLVGQGLRESPGQGNNSQADGDSDMGGGLSYSLCQCFCLGKSCPSSPSSHAR